MELSIIMRYTYSIMIETTNRRNENGVKDSTDCYRNINGIHFEAWTSDTSAFVEERSKAKELGLKTRIINGEFYREVPQP